MYFFILLCGASSWYLLYKSFFIKNNSEKEIIDDFKDQIDILDNKNTDYMLDHKIKLDKIHKELKESYPKYLHHKCLQNFTQIKNKYHSKQDLL